MVVKTPVVNLGKDTTISLGDSLLLDAGAGFSSYHWIGGGTTRYFHMPAFVPGKYFFYVDVTDSNGCEASDTIQVIIKDTGVSINDPSGKYSIKVYPNPAQGLLFVDLKFTDPSTTSMSIYSTDGKEMIKDPIKIITTHLERIDISSLAKGMYILKVIHGNRVDRFRVVVY